MFVLDSISDDEIDYFDELKTDYQNNAMLNFLNNLENSNDCDSIDTPNFIYRYKTTANIATQPKRFEMLLYTLDSIKGQFDEIRIYLNNYTEVPEELQCYTTHIGDDLTDNGKFFWSSNKNEYYFTLDDDIIYPPDYVEKTIPLIGNRLVSYHGKRLIGLNQRYYDNHRNYHYYVQLHEERKLDVIGTGVMAFNTNNFTPTLWKSPNYKMTDLIIALEAHMYNIPLVCLPKKRGWITHKTFLLDGIYFDFNRNDSIQTRMANMIQNYISSNIDMSIVNYLYKNESIDNIIDSIRKYENSYQYFVTIRAGNGSLIDKIKNSTNFNSYTAVESDFKRISKYADFYNDDIKFTHISTYKNCEFTNSMLVFLDDLILSKTLSSRIFKKMKDNSLLICHNIVTNEFPVSKLTLELVNGETRDLYIYQK